MIFNVIPKELIIALFLLALGQVTNVIVGTAISEYKDIFNREQFKKGIGKAVVIFIAIVFISIAAAIDKTLVIDGTPILEYILIAVKGMYIYYYGQATVKVVKLIGFKTDEGIEIYKKMEGNKR